jgi:hypothetical protein
MSKLNLIDIAKRSGNDAQVGLIESMAQSNALLSQLPFKVINGTSYKVKKRTGLPTAYNRAFNQGIALSKSVITDYIYQTFLYNSRSAVDVKIADTAPEGGSALRNEEDISHIAAVGNLYNSDCFYGNNQTNVLKPDGIATILNSTALATVKAGTGAGGSSTSIYFVSFNDANTPQGRMKGVEGVATSGQMLSASDKGQVLLNDADNNPFWHYVTEIDAMLGFAVYDVRSVGRYMGLTSAIAPTATVMDSIITAMLPFQANAILVNKTGLNLIKGLKSTITYYPAEREIKLSPASYDGIPVFLDENILDTE